MNQKRPIIAQWIEVGYGALWDAPPKTLDGQFHYWLFLNRCQVRSGAKGDVLHRVIDVHEIIAPDQEAMDDRVRAYVLRPDVRLMRDGIEIGDRHELPATEPARPDLIDGTAAIYVDKSTL